MKLMRCRQWAMGLGFTGAGAGLMLFNVGVTRPEIGILVRALLVLAGAGVGWFIVTRVALAGIRLDHGGVLVRNPLATRFLRWEDVESFSLGRYVVFSKMGTARLRDGSRIPLFGIQAVESMLNPGDRQAQEIVARLNAALAASAG